MKTYKLMIKTYTNGKKYLCQTTRINWEDYRGSGLEITPDLVLESTTLIGEYTTKEELTKCGLYYSGLYNVVEDTEFLNLTVEKGQGGYLYHGPKVWGTDGKIDRHFQHVDELPEGWWRGRTQNHGNKRGLYWVNNGVEQKMVTETPEGWNIGRMKKIYITNGITTKRVSPYVEIPDGWYRGRNW